MALVSGPQIHLIGGGYFHFDNPEASTFEISDIAHALSLLCRFTGHVREFYSVAQHCTLASYLVPNELALPTLLHDSAEAFINDLSSPLKHCLPEYMALEKRVEAAVFEKLGVAEYFIPKMHPYIKHADLVMLATEQRDLMPPAAHEWAVLHGIEPARDPIRPWGPVDAAWRFLARYEDLTFARQRTRRFEGYQLEERE